MPQIPDFVPAAPVPAATIERYRGRIPDPVLAVWQSQGFGDGVGGWLKVIDPDLTIERLGDALPAAGLIPLFATALADIVVWDEARQKSRVLLYRYGRVDPFGTNFDLVIGDLSDPEALAEDWLWEPFPAAAARLGRPGYSDAFMYVPLLALGGPESPDHLDTGDLLTHVQLITQLAGPLRYV
ncbi:T6SS immunity protein Tdi1 domain-containing protein [Schumannella soli]|uniref:DUF1851 domain-containing protein n=1 Tax=Schumannella soli TaxID=2590779 RepID=A0A506Y6Y6_9MICO|nr:T6SS immunity protein Tdi1 domain-containing protein [Schumannella soli]TPW77822.1 DUF1851 domain-containing protein [Schumannella soli]